MKKFTKYLLLLFASMLLIIGCNSPKPGTPEYLLEKRGFKIFKLSQDIEKYKGYISYMEDKKDRSIKIYEVQPDKDPSIFKIGDSVVIDAIFLHAYKDQILDIRILVKGKYREPFLRTLKAAYGPGENKGTFIEGYEWSAPNKKAEITLRYQDRSIDFFNGGSALAIFQDEKLIAKEEQDKANKAKGGVQDL